MKVIIPVAGIGSRLRPHTHSQPKALVPVAGKPILSHIIDELTEAGLTQFVFVIGYLGDKIEQYIRETYPNLQSHFVVQEPREGLAHAIWLSKKHIKPKDDLLIVLGDTIFDVDLKSVLKLKQSALGTKKVDDPRIFGVAELDKQGHIIRLVEKPKIPKSNLALVGIYLIRESDKLLQAIDYNIKNKITTQGEYHLTDAIMRMIENGSKVTTFPVENWYDCGNKNSLLETNAILLKRDSDPVKKGGSPNIINSIIIPPVRIAENTKVINSIIGPNVSIGEHTNVTRSIIEDTIIGSYARLENSVLYHSVIGSDALLSGMKQSLNIGDST